MDEIKKSVCLPSSTFDTVISSRLSVLNARNLDRSTVPEQVMFYEEEPVYILGQHRNVKRLYVRKPGEKYVGVGWVINEDINFCMICAKQFGLFLYRHHCRSCGNLVCDSCSPYLLLLDEIIDEGEQRVCIQCFWGQDPVHVARWRLNSEYGDINDDRFDDNDFDIINSKETIVSTPIRNPPTITQNGYSSPSAPEPNYGLQSKEDNASHASISPLALKAPVAVNVSHSESPNPNPNPNPAGRPETNGLNKHTGVSTPKSPIVAMGSNPLRKPGTDRKGPPTSVAKPTTSASVGTTTTIIPIPGVVIKSKTKSGGKIFINICHSSLVPAVIPSDSKRPPLRSGIQAFNVIIGSIRNTTDKSGEQSKLVDVAVNSDKFKECMEETVSNSREKLVFQVLKLVSAAINDGLDEDYKTPKTPRNYKGGSDVLPMSLPVASEPDPEPVVAQVNSDDEVDDEVDESDGHGEHNDNDSDEDNEVFAMDMSTVIRQERTDGASSIKVSFGPTTVVSKISPSPEPEGPRISVAQKILAAERERKLAVSQKAKEETEKKELERLRIEEEDRERQLRIQQQTRKALEEAKIQEQQRISQEAALVVERREKEKELAAEAERVELERQKEKKRKDEAEQALRLEQERVARDQQLQDAQLREAERQRVIENVEKERKLQEEMCFAKERAEKEAHERDIEQEKLLAALQKLADEAHENQIKESERLQKLELELEAARTKALRELEEAKLLREQKESEQKLAALRQEEERKQKLEEERIELARQEQEAERLEKHRLASVASQATSSDANSRPRLESADSENGVQSSSAAHEENNNSDDEIDADDASQMQENIIIKPTPGIVLKTKTKKTGIKFFINLCHHELVPVSLQEGILESFSSRLSSTSRGSFSDTNLCVIIGECRETTDKSGDVSILVDVVVNSGKFFECMNDEVTNAKDKLCLRVLKSVGKSQNELLDEDYKTPKTRDNYKSSDGNSSVLSLDITSYVNGAAPRRGSGNGRESTMKGILSSSSSANLTSRLSGLLGKPQEVTMLTPPNITYAPAEDQSKWGPLLARGERIIATGPVGKKNPMGLTQTRQLILTDGPRLLYADAKTMTLKGEVECPLGIAPQAILNNPSTVDVKTSQRVYRFIDADKGAKFWVEKINSTFKTFK